MEEILYAAGLVAPYYNLVLVAIAIWLFVVLFKTPSKKVFLKPWIVLFFSLLIYVVEEILTVLRTAQIVKLPIHINGFFELVIISLFIYALLLQREAVGK
ncbi:MAG: hypothetical protein HY363_01715 [Candidatus Aenigmarchaeota archaeon]|nr:hypothetical protein [Candidatus Aenigmarchaeota archaeon]